MEKIIAEWENVFYSVVVLVHGFDIVLAHGFGFMDL